MSGVAFRVLGPLDVEREGRPVAFAGGQQRALLALLLIHANQRVSAERLVEELWGEPTPPRAVKRLQVAVTRLRRTLSVDGADRAADAPLRTVPGGYLVVVAPGELDAQLFQTRSDAGRRQLAEGDAAAAAETLREALGLWRGPAFAEVACEPFAQAEIRRLDEQRLAAVEARVEADLALGRHAELVAELQQLVTEQPWRERLHAQLMLALYRSGRQADALDAYRQAREALVEQLGIEPGPALHDLHQAMLSQEPTLEAPRPKSVPPRRGALPAPPNRTIGRGRELGALAERLQPGISRLLTLTGAGGVGKTRLALEAARAIEPDFGDGAHFVSLAALQRPDDVPAAIIKALEIVVVSGETADQAVERFLAPKQLLLVLDNCEHLPGAAPFIGDVVASCPDITVLATSREPLVLQAEQRYPVLPLTLPEPGPANDLEALAGQDTIALFCERARAQDPEFALDDDNAAAVVEICRRLDGLPLAIELAAARCGLLSPAEIAARLDVALHAPGAAARDAPARHQTLRATIDWSHNLLSDTEKTCFARFAAFAGGATVEAAEAVTAASLDSLDRLVAKNLLVRQQQARAPSRLAMLETIRAYAAERLAITADDAAHERHYRYYLALARRHGHERALWGVHGDEHLAQLDADNENLHAALRWTVQRSDRQRAVAMVAALGHYWLMRDRYADAVEWTERALGLPGPDVQPELRVHALCINGVALWPLGRGHEGSTVLADAEAAARELDDPGLLSRALEMRVDREGGLGRPELAEALAQEALECATTAGDDWALAMAANMKAIVAPTIAQLHERVERAAALLDQVGNVYHHADLLSGAGYSALCMGSDHDAKRFVARAIPLVRELGHPYQWMMLCGNFGLAALLTGDTTAARDAFDEELQLARELVVPGFAAEGLMGLAAIAIAHDDAPRAARLLGASTPHGDGEDQDALERRLHATVFAPARERHGVDAWDAAFHEGAAMTFNDAIAYALGESHAQTADRSSRSTVLPG